MGVNFIRGEGFLTQRLKYDKDFIPCPVTEGDEIFRNGIFEFNISKLINYLEHENSGIAVTEIDVGSYYEKFSSINESHVDSVSLDQPVIIAEISPGRYNLIDGNHRVEKARRNGEQKLPSYRIDVTRHLRFLTSKRAYIAYIEYWNGKVSQNSGFGVNEYSK
jgi:hypothetical protein